MSARREYTPADTLRLAKRHNNSKRAYLLVNPLQAKHLPVSPRAALEMMETLGQKLAAAWPGTSLVIGFAETATAIAAMTASSFGPDCVYLHTTREAIAGDALDFAEEHSHAVLQRLSTVKLQDPLTQTARLLLVDDELSTGKTLRNIVAQLRAYFPALEDKAITAASILNRLSERDDMLLRAAEMQSDCLVKLPPTGDFTALHALETHAPRDLRGAKLPPCGIRCVALDIPLPNPRYALRIGDYLQACREAAEAAVLVAAAELCGTGLVLVLGTEECMLPALFLGRLLEERGHSVLCHATTRSPIGVCDAPDYPIRSGVSINSFYEAGRETYLYNLQRYDTVLVVSDTESPAAETALSELAVALRLHGCRQVLCFAGGRHV